MADAHDWITLHLVRFAAPVDGVGNPQVGPSAAQIWRFAPSTELGPQGFACRNATWGGFALYDNRADAEAVFADPGAHIPCLEDAVEAWHALMVPYAHRGSVGWRDTVETDSAIRPIATDPKGPLAVITSAGFDTHDGPPDPARLARFIEGVVDVIGFYRSLPANRTADAFSSGPVDGKEGCTVSLWADDPSMIAAAYKAGTHKGELDYHTAHSHFDRSSFTRGRIMGSKGTWGGVDPVRGMGPAPE